MAICNVNCRGINKQQKAVFRIKLWSGNVSKSESIICGRDKVDLFVMILYILVNSFSFMSGRVVVG